MVQMERKNTARRCIGGEELQVNLYSFPGSRRYSSVFDFTKKAKEKRVFEGSLPILSSPGTMRVLRGRSRGLCRRAARPPREAAVIRANLCEPRADSKVCPFAWA